MQLSNQTRQGLSIFPLTVFPLMQLPHPCLHQRKLYQKNLHSLQPSNHQARQSFLTMVNLRPQIPLCPLIQLTILVRHPPCLQQREHRPLIIFPCLQQKESPHSLQLLVDPNAPQQEYLLIVYLFLPMMMLIIYSVLPCQDPPNLSSIPTIRGENLRLIFCQSTMVISLDHVFDQARYSPFLHS